MRHVIDLTSKAVRKHQECSNVRIPALEQLYPVQDHPEGDRAADLATNSSEGLHSRRTPRIHPDGDGLDKLPSPPIRDQRLYAMAIPNFYWRIMGTIRRSSTRWRQR